MVDLIARKPFAGLLPVEGAQVRLVGVPVGAITWIAPNAGWKKPVSQALKAVVGVGLPGPGRSTGKAGARCVWFGEGQVLLLGGAVPVLADAAVADLSDGFDVCLLEGEGAQDVLARLVAVDLRPAQFRRGHAARTMLRHVPVTIVKTRRDAFELILPSSMVRTAIHDLSQAIRTVSARLQARPQV